MDLARQAALIGRLARRPSIFSLRSALRPERRAAIYHANRRHRPNPGAPQPVRYVTGRQAPIPIDPASTVRLR